MWYPQQEPTSRQLLIKHSKADYHRGRRITLHCICASEARVTLMPDIIITSNTWRDAPHQAPTSRPPPLHHPQDELNERQRLFQLLSLIRLPQRLEDAPHAYRLSASGRPGIRTRSPHPTNARISAEIKHSLIYGRPFMSEIVSSL